MAMHLSEEFVADWFEHYAGWSVRRNVRYKVKRNYSDHDLLAWPTPVTDASLTPWLNATAVPTAVQVKWRKTIPFPLGRATNEDFAGWIVGTDLMVKDAARALVEPGQLWDLMLVALATSIDLEGDALANREHEILETVKRADWYEDDAGDLRAVHLVRFEDLAKPWASRLVTEPGGWDESAFAFNVRLLNASKALKAPSMDTFVDEYAGSDVALTADELTALCAGAWDRARAVGNRWLPALASWMELTTRSCGLSQSEPDPDTGRNTVWYGRRSNPWWLGLSIDAQGNVHLDYWGRGGERATVEAGASTASELRVSERNFVRQMLEGSTG